MLLSEPSLVRNFSNIFLHRYYVLMVIFTFHRSLFWLGWFDYFFCMASFMVVSGVLEAIHKERGFFFFLAQIQVQSSGFYVLSFSEIRVQSSPLISKEELKKKVCCFCSHLDHSEKTCKRVLVHGTKFFVCQRFLWRAFSENI